MLELQNGLQWSHLVRGSLEIVCDGMTTLTSARIVLDQELVQSTPASAHTDHHGGPQDSHKPQLLGISKLKMLKMSKKSLQVF